MGGYLNIPPGASLLPQKKDLTCEILLASAEYESLGTRHKKYITESNYKL